MERNRRTGKSTILVNDVAVKERSHYICLTLTPTPSLMVYNVNPKCIIAFIVSSRPLWTPLRMILLTSFKDSLVVQEILERMF